MTQKIGRRVVVLGTAGLAAGTLAAPAIAQEPAGEITLVAYSGIFQDNYTAAVVNPFMQRFPRIRVNYFAAANSAAMLGSLRAQKAAPQSDVVILDVSVQKAANDEGLFARLDPALVPNLAQLNELGRPTHEGMGPAVTFDHLVLLYNRELVQPPPRTWTDLWDPRLKGQIAITAAPDIQGLALTILINKINGVDYKSSIDGAIRKLRELAPSVQTWNPNPDQYTLVINGTAKAAIGWNARSQIYSDQSQGKLGVLLPEDGTVFQINTINAVAGSRNSAAAQTFLNYAIGAEAQKAFTERMFYAPVNSTAQVSPGALARTATAPENMARVVPVDWSFVAANRDRWNERWRREVIR
jgi:putative spermidine/putrescine transport system substrate-binding protein